MQILTGRRFAVHALAFSHCGRWLAAGGRGGVHLWDTTAPSEKPRELPSDECTSEIAFRTDERLLWISEIGVVRTCALNSGSVTDCGRFSHANPIVSPNGALAVAVFTNYDRTVRELRATEPPVTLWEFPDEAPEAAGFSADGTRLAVARLPERGSVHRTVVCDAATGARRLELAHPATDRPQQLVFSARNEFLLARWSASLVCWNLAEPEAKPTRTFNPSRKHFVALAVHPEGPALTVDNERLVRVWDVPSLLAVRTIEWDVGKLYAVAVSPDGSRAAVGSHTGRVLIWDWD